MRYLILGTGQGLAFLLAVINIRACAKGFLWPMVITDFLILVINFAMIHHIAQAGTLGEMFAYAAGGSLGSALALRLTRRWDDAGTGRQPERLARTVSEPPTEHESD